MAILDLLATRKLRTRRRHQSRRVGRQGFIASRVDLAFRLVIFYNSFYLSCGSHLALPVRIFPVLRLRPQRRKHRKAHAVIASAVRVRCTYVQ